MTGLKPEAIDFLLPIGNRARIFEKDSCRDSVADTFSFSP